MHLRAGRWARRALPSLSPLSRALAPDAATPHAGRSEATTEGSRAGPGPQPSDFADGRREEPPLAARTPVLPAALLAASKASKGTGGGCAVFAPGVLACPGRSQVARGVTAKGVLYNPAHSRSAGQPARDARSAQQPGAAGRTPAGAPFSGSGTSVSGVQKCGPELCRLFSDGGFRGPRPLPSAGG